MIYQEASIIYKINSPKNPKTLKILKLLTLYFYKMMYYTHLAFGFLVSLLAIELFDIQNKIIFILITILFSIFPDIDARQSKIGKKYKFISTTINFIFGHRGFFHAIYIPLLLYFIFYNINN